MAPGRRVTRGPAGLTAIGASTVIERVACRIGDYPLHCAGQPIVVAAQTMRRRATYAAAEGGVRES